MGVDVFIKHFRKINGLTQEGFGEMIGVKGKQISKWECRKQEPTFNECRIMAKLMGITTTILLEGDEEKLSLLKPLRHPYHLGLEYMHDAICDYETLYNFLDAYSASYRIAHPEHTQIGSALFAEVEDLKQDATLYGSMGSENRAINLTNIALMLDDISLAPVYPEFVFKKENLLDIRPRHFANDPSYIINTYWRIPGENRCVRRVIFFLNRL